MPTGVYAGNYKDMSGLVFGRLVVIGRGLRIGNSGEIYWLCRCECGVEKEVNGASLRNGNTAACGCQRNRTPVVDITGQRFGRYVVLERGSTSKHKSIRWVCQCDCGTVKEVEGSALRDGRSQSCGCLHRDRVSDSSYRHGYSAHYLYRTWAAVKQRVLNPNCSEYRNYGARGVTIYEPWIDDSGLFVSWILENLGERPPGKSLDRINNGVDPPNETGYRPGNLRWATASEQNSNKRPSTKRKKVS